MRLLLGPRFRRWCHLMRHLLRWPPEGHRAVTFYEGWRTAGLACDCGRVFWSAHWPLRRIQQLIVVQQPDGHFEIHVRSDIRAYFQGRVQ